MSLDQPPEPVQQKLVAYAISILSGKQGIISIWVLCDL